MKVEELEPGHVYAIPSLDGDFPQRMQFVERCDPQHPEKFPGNTKNHPGATSQFYVHAMIKRRQYIQNQKPHRNNLTYLDRLRELLWLDEERAAELHGYDFTYSAENIDKLPMCDHCGHVVCEKLGNTRAKQQIKPLET